MGARQPEDDGRGVDSRRSATSHERVYDHWINGLWAGRRSAEDTVSPGFVGHWPTREIHGPRELQKVVDDTLSQFADLMFLIEVGPFSDGDMVAARWIGTGSGPNGPARFIGNDILRVANGKVIEYWSCTSGA